MMEAGNGGWICQPGKECKGLPGSGGGGGSPGGGCGASPGGGCGISVSGGCGASGGCGTSSTGYCSTHEMPRAISNLMDRGDGKFTCKPGRECQPEPVAL